MKPDTHDDNLLKQLDLINFWEPFDRKIPELRVGIKAIIRDIGQKQVEARQNKTDVKSGKPKPFTQPLVFSYNTINQREALKPLEKLLLNQVEVMSENADFVPDQLPDVYLRAASLAYAPQLLRWFYTFKGRDREVFRARYYNFYRRLGQYHHYKKCFALSRETVRAYIASNDHSGLSQVGFVAARHAGIKTVYIQHASVSDRFPPLRTTVALLDGEDAAEKYRAAGKSDTKIHLIGSLKYDPWLRDSRLDVPGRLVGVCIGLAYCDIGQNIALCEGLEASGIPFALRFHPLCSEETRGQFAGRGWEVSPTEEPAPEFVLRCHTVVSGDSNILLEAIILKRRPLYFASDGEGIDYYDFVKRGITNKAYFRYEEVMRGLDQPFDIGAHRRKAQYYHHTLGTEHEGKSAELAREIIDGL